MEDQILDFEQGYFPLEKYFPQVALPDIKWYLDGLDQASYQNFMQYPFKNPNHMFWAAFPLGILGVDRFILGDIGLGIVKLLSFGMFFIGFAVDCFTIFERTKSYNYQKYLELKTGYSFS